MAPGTVGTVIFPAAGLSTRFLPVTKAQPKEMLPLVDKPTIQYGVEEAIDSGLERVIIVLNEWKDAIRKHFAPAPELRALLESRGKDADVAVLDEVDELCRKIQIGFVEDEPLGLGHAVLVGGKAAGGGPCAVLLPDDVIVGVEPCLKQLLEAHAETGATVLATRRIPPDQVSRYGIISVSRSSGNLHEVADVVEKPDPKEAPSDLAILGRYVLNPDVFEELPRTAPGAGGEIQLTDAVKRTLGRGRVVALEFEGEYHDAGTVPGYLRANMALALKRPDLRASLVDVIQGLLVGES
jgi:UTP--glucose-1-phosphate uridylyltransferase